MGRRVVIVGAGVAGLTVAIRLREAGDEVIVVDKGRGVGGRCSTRRTDPARFDHGAQYFTVRDDSFRDFLRIRVPDEAYAPWPGPFARMVDGRIIPDDPTTPRLVGVPGMSALPRAMAAGLDVRSGFQVAGLTGGPGRWTLVDEAGGRLGPFDWVVVTAPPAQSAAILAGSSPIAEAARGVVMRACFSLMVVPAGDVTLPAAGVRCDHPVLGWVADSRTRPGRPATPALVIQSGHDWADAHLEVDPADVARALRDAAAEAFGIDLDRPAWESAHRWRFAAPRDVLGRPCLVDEPAGLAACGDWCLAGKIEGAFLSGAACAGAIRARTPG